MGLLDYVSERLPKPKQADVEKVQRRLKQLNGGNPGYQYGLLGPSEDQLAQMRSERRLPAAESPQPGSALGVARLTFGSRLSRRI